MATLADLLVDGKNIEENPVNIGFRFKNDPKNIIRIFPKKISLRFKISEASFPYLDKPFVHGEDSWAGNKEKVKDAKEKDLAEMRSILNKLAKGNLDKLILTIQERSEKINYEDTQIITMVFKKIISEHSNTAVYISFCKKLYDMELFSIICFEQFKNNPKNILLCPFIAHLYYNKIINVSNIQDYINIAFDDLQQDTDDEDDLYVIGADGFKDKSILISASLLKNIFDIVPVKTEIILFFSEIVVEFYKNRAYRKARCRCLLMDLYEKYNKITAR